MRVSNATGGLSNSDADKLLIKWEVKMAIPDMVVWPLDYYQLF